MKRTIEVEAKKVEQAIAEGLKILNVTIDEAEVKIISTGGFLKKAKIEMTTGEDDPNETKETIEKKEIPSVKIVEKKAEKIDNKKAVEKKAEKIDSNKLAENKVEKIDNNKKDKQENSLKSKKEFSKDYVPKQKEHRKRETLPITREVEDKATKFLSELIEKMGIKGSLTTDTTDGLAINIDTEDSSIIGHHGETLDALQYLTSLIVNADTKGYSQIELDALNYRNKRTEILRKIAIEQAEKCLSQGRRIALKPMNSAERKVIHAYLTENSGVVTKSEGFEPNRKIVIYPAKK